MELVDEVNEVMQAKSDFTLYFCHERCSFNLYKSYILIRSSVEEAEEDEGRVGPLGGPVVDHLRVGLQRLGKK